MRKVIFISILMIGISSSMAQAQFLSGLSAASDSLAKGMDRRIEIENQKELMLYQYQLEEERRKRIAAESRVTPLIDETTEAPTQLSNLRMVASVIPDWIPMMGTAKFTTWAKQQNRFGNITALSVYAIAEENPYQAIALLRKYQSDTR